MNLYFILTACMVTVETMKNNNKKITYFYQNGRVDRLKSNSIFAKEMFYGFHYFDKKYDVSVAEFSTHKTKFGKYFFLIFEKRIRNILKLPLYWSFVTNKENFKKISSSDYIVLSNNRVGCSVLPMIIFSKFLRNKTKSLTFIMGLFSNNPKYKILKFFQNIYIYLFLKNINYLIFLSEGEFDFASNKFKKYNHKFFFMPFAVDLDVWEKENNTKKEHILFVGNDGNRDYSLAESISHIFSDEAFIYVSEEINKKNVSAKSTILKGSWGRPAINDLELRNLYRSAKLTIIPLKESLQPSGQSVALQSIACGTPVLITKTQGFWDDRNFQDSKNIFFIEENNIQLWSDKIDTILNTNKENIDKIILNGIKTIKENYDVSDFNQKIESILFGNK